MRGDELVNSKLHGGHKLNDRDLNGTAEPSKLDSYKGKERPRFITEEKKQHFAVLLMLVSIFCSKNNG